MARSSRRKDGGRPAQSAVINNTDRYATDDADSVEQVTDPTLQMVDVNHTSSYRADVTYNQRSKEPPSHLVTGLITTIVGDRSTLGWHCRNISFFSMAMNTQTIVFE